MKHEEQNDGPAKTQTSLGPLERLPEWYPAWARELAELYFSGTTCVFVLHGNVHDLFRCPGKDGEPSYCNLSEFLTTQVFGNWDIVLGHDLSRGLRPRAGSDSSRLTKMMRTLTARWGEPRSWPPERLPSPSACCCCRPGPQMAGERHTCRLSRGSGSP